MVDYSEADKAGHRQTDDQVASLPAEVRAAELLKKVASAEKQVTNDLQRLAEQTGGKLEGLEHRIKSAESLIQQIETGARPEHIQDALRYTMTFASDALTAGLKEVMRQLEEAGYEKWAVKNTFMAGLLYKGVNCVFQTGDGQLFEASFHTPESFRVKEENGELLEVALALLKADGTAYGEDLESKGQSVEGRTAWRYFRFSHSPKEPASIFRCPANGKLVTEQSAADVTVYIADGAWQGNQMHILYKAAGTGWFEETSDEIAEEEAIKRMAKISVRAKDQSG